MITEPCNRRGAEVRPGFFRCDSNRLIHPEPGIVEIATCGICPYRNLPDRAPAETSAADKAASVATGTAAENEWRQRLTTPCVHRGAVIETGACNICGMKGTAFQAFACDLHGKCTVRRVRNDRPDLTVCLTCEAYAASDPTCESAQRRRPATPTDSR
jgi:hypothetical protein